MTEWYSKFNQSVDQSTYRFKEFDRSECQSAFKKLIDFYDPKSDDYLKTYFAFKAMYKLRDVYAQKIDVSVKMISSDQVLLTLSKLRPSDEKSLTETLNQSLKEREDSIKLLKKISSHILQTVAHCETTF